MKYKILSVVLLVVVLVSVASCSYNKVNMNKFEEITPEEFCEAYYNEFEVEVEPYENNYETRILADSLESSIVYHQYFDEDEAREVFEEAYERRVEYYEDNWENIQMNMASDRGYIIYDITGSEEIAEANQESLRHVWSRYTHEVYVPAIGWEQEEPTEYELTNENVREIGCFYYYHNIYIRATFIANRDADPSEFIAFLDELGLPYLLQEE